MNVIKAAGMTRISKRRAEKLFNQGETVYLLPCKMNPASPWACPAGYRKRADGSRGFDALVTHFTAAACNAETGRYPAYYVEI